MAGRDGRDVSHIKTESHFITLKKGRAGFGFNILGGIDKPCYPGNYGIYVAKIRENESAALDGRLREGDRILEAGGISLDNILHEGAAKVFRNATNDELLLRIERQRLDGENKGRVHDGVDFAVPSWSKMRPTTDGEELTYDITMMRQHLLLELVDIPTTSRESISSVQVEPDFGEDMSPSNERSPSQILQYSGKKRQKWYQHPRKFHTARLPWIILASSVVTIAVVIGALKISAVKK